MIPKLTALARSRSSRVSSSAGLPSTSAAVARCTSSPRWNASDQHRLAGQVGEDAQLDLRVVGRQQPRAVGSATNAPRISRPSGVRTGMFCRFGFVLERPAGGGRGLRERRVDAPVVGDRRPAARSRYVECSLVSSRQRSTTATIGCRSRILREHPLVGRVAGLALAVGGQAEPLEQHLAELLGRADRERAAGQLVGPLPRARSTSVATRARDLGQHGTGRRARRRPPWPPARRPAAARCRPAAASGRAPRGAAPASSRSAQRAVARRGPAPPSPPRPVTSSSIAGLVQQVASTA